MMPINKLLGQEILLVPRKVGSSLSSSSNERSVLKWINVLLQVISSEKKIPVDAKVCVTFCFFFFFLIPGFCL